MSENKHAKKLQDMGYEVGVAIEGYEDEGYEHEDGTRVEAQSCPTVYSVSGFGIQNLQVQEGDGDTCKRLSDPDAHQLRIDNLRDLDPTDSFRMDEGDRRERNLQLAVKFGDISEKQADEARKENFSEINSAVS